MVGIRHGQGVHWSSKAMRVVPEAVEGKINTLQDCHIIRMMKLPYDVMLFGSISSGFEKMLVPYLAQVAFRACLRTYYCSLL